MANRQDQKRIEQAEYRAKLVEAELNAVRQSKAYKAAKTVGIIKAQLKSDPVGLTKKVARVFLQEPSKVRHLLRSANRGAFISQAVVEQTAKYQEWILLNEPDEIELDEQREQSDVFAYKPLISIVTPVFNPPIKVLEELIESVLEQTYTNFELCLGNFGDALDVQQLIDKYEKIDTRIKNFVFTSNEGIAGNSNQILKKATGEFIALLDHDDTISPDALYENVRLLNQKPYDFIYSDKDKIDEQGNRFDPLFKPQLSPEMLLNINYLTHLNVMRTSIVREIGGWDSDTDGAQDWDIFLRVIDASKHIGHIPKILYHWRVIATSTAMSIETKPYALAGQRKAIDKYLAIHNIPAKTYHDRTELFVKWDKRSIDYSPIIFIRFSNASNTGRLIRDIKKVTSKVQFIVVAEESMTLRATEAATRGNAEVLVYRRGVFGATLQTYLRSTEKQPQTKRVLFIDDSIRLPKTSDWYENLVGWLSIEGVAAVSGRLVDRHDLIVDSGGVVTPRGEYFPLFFKYPRYYQGYIGNAEWVRNLSIISSAFCATTLDDLRAYSFFGKSKDAYVLDDYFLNLSQKKRLVMTPHSTASIYETDGKTLAHQLILPQDYIDKFNNPNLSAVDPMRLFDDEKLVEEVATSVQSEPVDKYQHDATILASTFDISIEEMARNIEESKHGLRAAPHSVAWILPSFDAVYAGLVNIFSFANYLNEKKLTTTIYILKADNNVSAERAAVIKVFPGLRSATFIGILPEKADAIKSHDIGIATQWATAYPLAKAKNISKKCYFIQDNEVNFYPKGSISALVELSYTFGFTAIAGTDGLLDMYKNTYGGSGVTLKSLVDLSAYHPRKDPYYATATPYKVFFYARPNMPRNAFELGVASLKKLKLEYGPDVEVITAGAQWDASAYGVEGMFTNLGKIAYEAVPKLYRSVDVGLMFMFSGHPGVTASELMASGCPVVVNEYDDKTWHELYVNEKTCLVSKSTASEIARNLKRCLTEQGLRRQLIDGGLEKTKSFYSGYDKSLEKAYQAIIK